MVNARQSTWLRPVKMALLVVSLAGASGALGAGCGSSVTTGGGDGGSGGDGGGGAGGSAPAGECFNYSTFKGDSPAVAFIADVLPILRRSCGVSTSCHGQQTPPSPSQHYLGPAMNLPDPTMEEIQALITALDVPAQSEPAMKVVEAGQPAQSFLMYKLDGLKCSRLKCSANDACGDLMPLGNSKPIDAAERDLIRRWIAQGAKAN